MLTIRDHLNSLPEPYRSEALEVVKEQDCEDRLELKRPNISASLYSAFTWYKTPQRFYYWYNFHSSLTTTL